MEQNLFLFKQKEKSILLFCADIATFSCLCWHPVTIGVPQGSMWVQSSYLDNVDKRIESTISKFADNIKLGGNVSLLEDRKVLLRDVNRQD